MTESTKEITTRAKQRVRAVGVHRPEEGGSFLAVIRAGAADPRCDVSKMEAMLRMQKEIMAEEARLAFIAAKLALTDKLPTINKDGKIEFKDKGHGAATLKFASFENINDVIKPLLKEFEFDLWFSSQPGVAGMINVIGNLEHRLGFIRQTTFPMPHDASGGKSGAQGWASAFSFGKRVTTIGLLNIQTKAIEDRDRDGNEGNFKPAKGGAFTEAPQDLAKVTPAQRDKLVAAMTDAGVSEAKFRAKYGVQQVGFLPAALYQAALDAIAEHKANKQHG